MNVDAVEVTGEADPVYNCLAWTLGLTNTWVWPWPQGKVTKAQFDALYKARGFDPAATGPVAVFGMNTTDMTHGCISGSGHGTRWESKLGQYIRITHGLGEMEGETYGKTLGFYAPHARLQAPGRGAAKGRAVGKQMKLTKDEVTFLKKRAIGIDKGLRERFDASYSAWKADWQHPAIVISSNPSIRTYSIHFLELVTLGPAILPLLMTRLYEDVNDFFALQIVDRLLPPALVVSYELDDELVLGGEQGRALATVRRWISYSA
jgi:hypothetical protein